jgi:serine/threonine protein phosphatase 1
MNGVTASLDGGCGFGGTLICAGMEASGDIFELMEA